MVEDKESRLLLLFLVGLLAFFLAFMALEWHLKEEKGFTEVYLGENESLVKAEEALTVEFFIDSHERQATVYAYSVSAGTTARGSVELLPGQKKRVTVPLAFSEAGINQRVFIEVQPQDKEPMNLWYWVNVE